MPVWVQIIVFFIIAIAALEGGGWVISSLDFEKKEFTHSDIKKLKDRQVDFTGSIMTASFVMVLVLILTEYVF